MTPKIFALVIIDPRPDDEGRIRHWRAWIDPEAQWRARPSPSFVGPLRPYRWQAYRSALPDGMRVCADERAACRYLDSTL